MSDPTMDFLRELDDPSKYAVRRGVPIARALKQTRPDGKPLVITDDDLPVIAEFTAAHEAESGTVLRVTLGHVQPGQPQASQPPLVGFARAVRAGTFGPGGVKCVLADVYLSRSFADSGEASQYPFRSMEYRIDTGRISGLALLKTDPHSQLGVVQFSADGSAQIAFMEAGMPDQTPPPGQPPAGQPPTGDTGGSVQMSDDDKAKADVLFAYFLQANPWMAKCAAEYGKPEGGEPGGNGTTPPKGKEDDVTKDDTAKMQADLEANKAEIAKGKAELARLAKEADEAKVDGMLAKFEAVHECDIAFERDLLLKLSADDRTKYLANAAKRYPKKPVGDLIDTYRGHAEGGTGPAKSLDKAGVDKALALMQADPNLTVEAAREKVLKG